MMTRLVMMRRRNSRRWSRTGMRPSGSTARRRRRRATMARLPQACGRDALLRLGQLAAQLAHLLGQALQPGHVALQPLRLPEDLVTAAPEHDQREDPGEAPGGDRDPGHALTLLLPWLGGSATGVGGQYASGFGAQAFG